jgi:hypothetical protein
VGALVDVELVESPPDMREASRKSHALIDASRPGKPIIGGIAVNLQDAGKARQMALDAFAATAVRKIAATTAANNGASLKRFSDGKADAWPRFTPRPLIGAGSPWLR